MDGILPPPFPDAVLYIERRYYSRNLVALVVCSPYSPFPPLILFVFAQLKGSRATGTHTHSSLSLTLHLSGYF